MSANKISQALRLAQALAPRIRDLQTVLSVPEVASDAAALTGLALVAELKSSIQSVEDALILAAAVDSAIPITAYAQAAGVTPADFRHRITDLEGKGGEAPSYAVGMAGTQVLRTEPGAHIHIRQRFGVKDSATLTRTLDALRSQADVVHDVTAEDVCTDAGSERVFATIANAPRGARILVVIDGVGECAIQRFAGAIEADPAWVSVTLVWVDRRPESEGTAVTIEAALGHVLSIDEEGETMVLGGMNGPGLKITSTVDL